MGRKVAIASCDERTNEICEIDEDAASRLMEPHELDVRTES